MVLGRFENNLNNIMKKTLANFSKICFQNFMKFLTISPDNDSWWIFPSIDYHVLESFKKTVTDPTTWPLNLSKLLTKTNHKLATVTKIIETIKATSIFPGIWRKLPSSLDFRIGNSKWKTRDDKNRDKKSLSIFYFKIENNVEI